ncbi:MAG: phosphoenolpyruvate carboxykinase (GTP) [Ignavibacteria bacterium]|nr:phosphoenolpyruvate carboxykinase (GTP) [Ignavibacteria bacterium]
MLDWQGREWPATDGKAAHPNSRFPTPAGQCLRISPNWGDPRGVPISAIVRESRQSRVLPPVMQAFD